MDIKNRKKIIVLNLLIFAALFLLVTLNKELIRPKLATIPVANVLSGCFPNFIAAYLISLAFVNPVLLRNPKSGRLIVYASSSVIFLILTLEELKPMWGASTHYDLFDVVASGFGSALAILTFELIRFRRRSRIKIS